MSKYVENTLTNGETIILKAKKSFWALVPCILWCVILLVGVIVLMNTMGKILSDVEGGKNQLTLILLGTWALLGLLPLIIKIIELCCSHLCITNKRVIGKTGILRLKTLDYPIQKVDNVSIKAGILGNLFHYSTVTVLGGGGSDANIRFKGIANAAQFKNAVTEAVEKHAEEARKAQAEEIARAMGR